MYRRLFLKNSAKLNPQYLITSFLRAQITPFPSIYVGACLKTLQSALKMMPELLLKNITMTFSKNITRFCGHRHFAIILSTFYFSYIFRWMLLHWRSSFRNARVWVQTNCNKWRKRMSICVLFWSELYCREIFRKWCAWCWFKMSHVWYATCSRSGCTNVWGLFDLFAEIV